MARVSVGDELEFASWPQEQQDLVKKLFGYSRQAAYDEGYESGRDAGYNAGVTSGYEEGYNEAKAGKEYSPK